eukprot:768590-Hanusia_phi.AAC.11
MPSRASLAVSRALGDVPWKVRSFRSALLVTAAQVPVSYVEGTPDVTSTKLTGAQRKCEQAEGTDLNVSEADDEFVIIGCDGVATLLRYFAGCSRRIEQVWDVLDNQEAVDLARRHALPAEARRFLLLLVNDVLSGCDGRQGGCWGTSSSCCSTRNCIYGRRRQGGAR